MRPYGSFSLFFADLPSTATVTSAKKTRKLNILRDTKTTVNLSFLTENVNVT
jgi:hypothetical protein